MHSYMTVNGSSNTQQPKHHPTIITKSQVKSILKPGHIILKFQSYNYNNFTKDSSTQASNIFLVGVIAVIAHGKSNKSVKSIIYFWHTYCL